MSTIIGGNADRPQNIHAYNGYALRYLRVNVTASAAGRSLTMTVCCDL